MRKHKYLNSKHIPPQFNILWLPVVYMMVGYFGLPIWVFAIYATLWVLLFGLAILLRLTSDNVSL